ncbi:type II toxin-antitoxin system HipA family toxin [Polyangium aurulentum]|uniref:type II toxin-antitoxin system HipA family toxin n=1 Tax=Polyangium aurulentum TaxID=2567896 RepID=UPI00146C6365|nr:type II toxin-antitoxin system HipA family toxin [Polyangium aurulentum]UQA55361.1 type II toxin-antitoxin system HipA family toxin [Polyangium aurulentum]
MKSLHIRLHGHDVGVLRKDTRITFELFQSYLDLAPRPVLGQAFEDNLRVRRAGGGGKLPAFFSNLLPEGSLRERLARSLDVDPDDEFALLTALGEDLPGAVTATLIDDVFPGLATGDAVEHEEPAPSSPREEGAMRFSLAGVQLKLSMLREGERLTLPASGRGGKWIVKLPSLTYLALPENEHATMTWAAQSGIRVAEHELVPLDRLHGVPRQLLEGLTGRAFVTRRYDRLESDRRVHQEDFAQVLDVYPEQKYKATNHETIANIVLQLSGREGFREFLRRLVFVVLSGNGDAHLKNWSLWYPDDLHAELSPAYDQVATVQYIPHEKLALNLAKSKSFEDVSLASFQRLARRLGLDEPEVTAAVQNDVAATLAAWRALRDHLSVPEAYRSSVDEHLARLPLARGP